MADQPTRLLTWKAQPADSRDYKYSAPRALKIPTKVDLRAYCSAIEDQGSLGSCTGQAVVGALEWLENKASASFVDLSRLFVYYNERALEGTTKEDAGAYLRTGIKVISKYGVCNESLWPYDESKVLTKPDTASYENAKSRKFLKYTALSGYNQMISCLAEGYPFVFGTLVNNEFIYGTASKTGQVSMLKDPYAADVGGHALLVVGYDMTKNVFIVRNSWGTAWGDKGYCYFPVAYLKSTLLSSDFWTIRPNSAKNILGV